MPQADPRPRTVQIPPDVAASFEPRRQGEAGRRSRGSAEADPTASEAGGGQPGSQRTSHDPRSPRSWCGWQVHAGEDGEPRTVPPAGSRQANIPGAVEPRSVVQCGATQWVEFQVTPHRGAAPVRVCVSPALGTDEGACEREAMPPALRGLEDSQVRALSAFARALRHETARPQLQVRRWTPTPPLPGWAVATPWEDSPPRMAVKEPPWMGLYGRSSVDERLRKGKFDFCTAGDGAPSDPMAPWGEVFRDGIQHASPTLAVLGHAIGSLLLPYLPSAGGAVLGLLCPERATSCPALDAGVAAFGQGPGHNRQGRLLRTSLGSGAEQQTLLDQLSGLPLFVDGMGAPWTGLVPLVHQRRAGRDGAPRLNAVVRVGPQIFEECAKGAPAGLLLLPAGGGKGSAGARSTSDSFGAPLQTVLHHHLRDAVERKGMAQAPVREWWEYCRASLQPEGRSVGAARHDDLDAWSVVFCGLMLLGRAFGMDSVAKGSLCLQQRLLAAVRAWVRQDQDLRSGDYAGADRLFRALWRLVKEAPRRFPLLPLGGQKIPRDVAGFRREDGSVSFLSTVVDATTSALAVTQARAVRRLYEAHVLICDSDTRRYQKTESVGKELQKVYRFHADADQRWEDPVHVGGVRDNTPSDPPMEMEA